MRIARLGERRDRSTPLRPIAARDATGVGVLGELQELPGGQAGRIVDDVAVEIVDLVGSMGSPRASRAIDRRVS